MNIYGTAQIYKKYIESINKKIKKWTNNQANANKE